MRKIIFILCIILTTKTTHSQHTVMFYKNLADRFLTKTFGATIVSKLICREIYYGLTDDQDEYEFSKYEVSKLKQLKFKNIKFLYSLPSKQIQDTYDFFMVVTRSNKIVDSLSEFNEIPDCILKDDNCPFIKSDSAIALARKDLIMYPNNLVADFYKNKNDNGYHWLIQSIEPQDKTNKNSGMLVDENQFRRVDAITGKVSLFSFADGL